MKLIIPENYDPVLTVRETQEAIKYIRDTFQYEFGKELNLEYTMENMYHEALTTDILQLRDKKMLS